uniref:Putative glucose-methanol-choline (GMC) oxidoreductase n=1 Tax=Chrysomela tremula TaxID=63687 RepID=B4F336_CHRTR|nr:putative glucose-methanol-choline (GMC) oxidoreductase [Chrysomela tremula]
MSDQILDATCPNNLQGSTAQLFLFLVNHLLLAKCDLGSPGHYPRDHGPLLEDGDEFDFIVVGGGSAGSVLANRLTSNGKWSVLVLEAGGYPSSISDIPLLATELANTNEDWQFVTEPSEKAFLADEHRRSIWPRGRALGGSSTINYMMYTRGNKRDFERWAELGNSGWDWNNIEKSYEEMENLVSDGEQKEKLLSLYEYESGEPVVDVIKQAAGYLGYPSVRREDPHNPLGYYSAPLTVGKGTRLNAAKAYLGKVKHRENLFVAVDALVTKVAIDNETKTATGVAVEINKRSLNLRARKEVILSAGAISSPQLLMLSGIGPKNHLDSLGIQAVENLPVGENLQDHMSFRGFAVKFGRGFEDSARTDKNLLDDAYEFFAHRRGAFSHISSLNLAGFINTRNGSVYPNIEVLHVSSHPGNDYAPIKVFRKLGFASFLDSLGRFGSNGQHLLSLFVALLKPRSRGRVTLKSTNPLDKPVIQAGYFTDEGDEDLENIMEGVRYLENLTETPAFLRHDPEIFRPEFCAHFAFRSDEYWKCVIRRLTSTLFHPVGTCKMGPEADETSVVDPWLRVKGVRNLRIADAAIMPEIVSSHTNAASMMIGYRAGEMIIDDWSSRQRYSEL